MNGINKVILLGTLGADPEIRHTQGGVTVANLSVATTEKWRDKTSGEQKEATEWHRVVFFGRIADVCGEYLKKGSQIYVEGKNQTRKWQDKNGNDRYSTEIQGRDMQMISSRQKEEVASSSSRSPAASGGAHEQPELDDEIPFMWAVILPLVPILSIAENGTMVI